MRSASTCCIRNTSIAERNVWLALFVSSSFLSDNALRLCSCAEILLLFPPNVFLARSPHRMYQNSKKALCFLFFILFGRDSYQKICCRLQFNTSKFVYWKCFITVLCSCSSTSKLIDGGGLLIAMCISLSTQFPTKQNNFPRRTSCHHFKYG